MFHYKIDYGFIKKFSSKVTRNQLKSLITKEEELKSKILEAAKVNAAFMVKFGPKIILIFDMLKDYMAEEYTDLKDGTVTSGAFAIIYFLNPFDFLPDFLPYIGYFDDIMVINLVWENIREDLKKYARFKGIDFTFEKNI